MCSAATTLTATTGSRTAAVETLLAACTVGSRIPALAVVGEGAVALISAGLLAVSSLRLPLVLGKIVLRTGQVLAGSTILLIEVRLRSSTLLPEVA